MILNNFEKLLWGILNSTTATQTGITLISGDTRTNSSSPYFGSAFTISNYSGGNTATTASSSTSTAVSFTRMSLTFGSGTTDVTANDYQMESPCDTTSHFGWQNQVQSYVAGSLTKVITASIANISDENLTVSEIGVVVASNNSTYRNHILIARSLIPPPAYRFNS